MTTAPSGERGLGATPDFTKDLDDLIEQFRAAGLSHEAAADLQKFIDGVPDDSIAAALSGLRRVLHARRSAPATPEPVGVAPVSDITPLVAQRALNETPPAAEPTTLPKEDRPVSKQADQQDETEEPAVTVPETADEEPQTSHTQDSDESAKYELSADAWKNDILKICGEAYWSDNDVLSLLELLNGNVGEDARLAREHIAELMAAYARFLPVKGVSSTAKLTITDWNVMSRLSGYGLKNGAQRLPLDAVRSMYAAKYAHEKKTFSEGLARIFAELTQVATLEFRTARTEQAVPPSEAHESDTEPKTTVEPTPDPVSAEPAPKKETIVPDAVPEVLPRVPQELQPIPRDVKQRDALDAQDIAELFGLTVKQVRNIIRYLQSAKAFEGTPKPVAKGNKNTGMVGDHYWGGALNKILDVAKEMKKPTNTNTPR